MGQGLEGHSGPRLSLISMVLGVGAYWIGPFWKAWKAREGQKKAKVLRNFRDFSGNFGSEGLIRPFKAPYMALASP